MGEPPQKEPMKLQLVFFWGFLASLAVVGVTIWLFAAYETANWWWPAQDPKLTQDKWFEIVRNAVTTAAALGVGVTLFFSYRRQQTAEQTQRIGAEAQVTASEAQRTAARALELSNKQHALDQDRRNDSVTSELRLRYGKSAEQLGSEELPVKLAGIYSLSALADDWADLGNFDERQVCLDLLGAFFRLQAASGEASAASAVECKAAILDAITGRLQKDTAARKYWGEAKIRLANFGSMRIISGLTLRAGGLFSLEDVELGPFSRLVGVRLEGGTIGIDLARTNTGGRFSILKAQLSGGSLRCLGTMTAGQDKVVSVSLHDVTLDGAHLRFFLPGGSMIFTDCVFISGRLNFGTSIDSVTFQGCRFEGDVFTRAGLKAVASIRQLSVEGCEFRPGVPVLQSFEKAPFRGSTRGPTP